MTVANEKKEKIIALAGQPNTGKSTVFNRLTGSKQHVGNWPGKTVEQKSGEFRRGAKSYQLVDLPGTYSLTAGSLEEKIARDFIINDEPDVVIVMADASQLERSLYLLTEVKLLSVPVVLALNMMDVAEDQGKIIDVKGLKRKLGIEVVPMSAAKGAGIDELLSAVDTVADSSGSDSGADVVPLLDGDPVFLQVKQIIGGHADEIGVIDWVAVKLIEGDSEISGKVKSVLPAGKWAELISAIESVENGRLHAAGCRYGWIAEVLSKVVSKTPQQKFSKRGKRFDRMATHPVFGKAFAVLVMMLSFAVAMIIAFPIMGAVRPATVLVTDLVREQFTGGSFWFGSMLADGLIPGISVALMMLAFIFGVYIVFGLLEDVGYVARLAYVFDRPMNRIGLHGKSFMPLLMSFGCNIAGVTGTRVIDSWQQRMVTLVMASIVPCLALWAVVSFIGTIFFAAAMPLVILSLLVVMVLHLSLTSFLLRRFVVPGETSGLIMELPPYHKPNWKTIFGHVWVQVKAFLKRALTLIAALSIVTWALSYRADGNMELSVLASIGK